MLVRWRTFFQKKVTRGAQMFSAWKHARIAQVQKICFSIHMSFLHLWYTSTDWNWFRLFIDWNTRRKDLEGWEEFRGKTVFVIYKFTIACTSAVGPLPFLSTVSNISFIVERKLQRKAWQAELDACFISSDSNQWLSSVGNFQMQWQQISIVACRIPNHRQLVPCLSLENRLPSTHLRVSSI